MSSERWTALVDAPGVVTDPEPIRSVQCNSLAIDLGPPLDAPHLVVAALVGRPPAAVGREVMGRQVCRRLGEPAQIPFDPRRILPKNQVHFLHRPRELEPERSHGRIDLTAPFAAEPQRSRDTATIEARMAANDVGIRSNAEPCQQVNAEPRAYCTPHVSLVEAEVGARAIRDGVWALMHGIVVVLREWIRLVRHAKILR